VELSSTSSLLKAHLASFYHLFFNRHCCFCCSSMFLFVSIISSVQTCCLYCHYHSFLVRLTVTDLLNLLSLLLLELLSLTFLRQLTQQFAFIPLTWLVCLSSWSIILLSLLIHSLFQLHWLGLPLLCLCLHYSCHTLREPVTRALTPCAFVRPCAHTSFALALSWNQPTPWPQLEPHPPTAGLGLQARTGFNQILLLAITQVRGIEGGFQSKIIHPRWTRTPLKKSVLCKPS